MSITYRQPNNSDIGRMIECCFDGTFQFIHEHTLLKIIDHEFKFMTEGSVNGSAVCFKYARIKNAIHLADMEDIGKVVKDLYDSVGCIEKRLHALEGKV